MKSTGNGSPVLERIKMQAAEAALTRVVIQHAEVEQEELFFKGNEKIKGIKTELDNICAAIAGAVAADSCAIFFVTEDVAAVLEQRMIMRGGSGNLKAVLAAGRQNTPNLSGYSYHYLAHEYPDTAQNEQKKRIISGWPVTNRIWHLGEGCWANSNMAMNLLAGKPEDRRGRGDDLNYPNNGTLSSVFRCFVGIPIFARGGKTSIISLTKEEGSDELLGAASTRKEFLERYRVIGILKVEGKRPQRQGLPVKDEIFDEYAIGKWVSDDQQRQNVINDIKQRLDVWFSRYDNGDDAIRGIHALFFEVDVAENVNGFRLLNVVSPDTELKDFLDEVFKTVNTQSLNEKELLQQCLQSCSKDSCQRLERWFNSGNSIEAIQKLITEDNGSERVDAVKLLNVCKLDTVLVDHLTEVFHAQFSSEDVELLVSIAIQLGRILSRRTIEHAARHKIVISENEVGTLNIRYRDIKQLEALHNACDRLCQKVNYLLTCLKEELEHKKEQEVYAARVSELVYPRGPIRQVEPRTKEFISLFRKLVSKQERIEGQSGVTKLILHEAPFFLSNFGQLSERQAIVRGYQGLFFLDPPHGSAQARLYGTLGVEGAPQVTPNQRPEEYFHATICNERYDYDPNWPLVRRLLETYKVDDIPGVRIICDYLSDVDEVLDHLRARFPDWRLEIIKIDQSVEMAKEGGYRGTHITVKTDVSQLLSQEEADLLRNALGKRPGEGIEILCEIQLRTEYEHSLALKTHNLLYKREEKVPEELLGAVQIHSNQTHEIDHLADNVRTGIEAMFLPDDFGERRLLSYLRHRLTREGFTLVELGAQCAKKVHAKHLRYSGLPHYSHVIATCERLVYGFEVLDPEMIFLALLHDIWMPWTNESEEDISIVTSVAKELKDTNGAFNHQPERERELFQRLLKQRGCDVIFEQFGGRIDWENRLKTFQPWFWVVVRSFREFWGTPMDDLKRKRLSRLEKIRSEIVNRCAEGQESELQDWLKRAFVLEAAILLGRLEELLEDPNPQRQEENYLYAYDEFRIIKESLPISPTKKKVIHEARRAFRVIQMHLRLREPIEPWE